MTPLNGFSSGTGDAEKLLKLMHADWVRGELRIPGIYISMMEDVFAANPEAPERNTGLAKADLGEPGAVRTNTVSAPQMALHWIPTTERQPEVCVPVIGFAERWVDSEYNPMGMRECFRNDEEWLSGAWNNSQDCWDTATGSPEYWMPHPPVPSDPSRVSSDAVGASSPKSSSLAVAAGQEEGEKRRDWWTVISGRYLYRGMKCVHYFETSDGAKTVCDEINASLREKEYVKTREIEDAFIERMAERLKAAGVDWSDCDGDDDPAVIIGNYFAARLSAEPDPTTGTTIPLDVGYSSDSVYRTRVKPEPTERKQAEVPQMATSVQPSWCLALPIQQQSVLLLGARGPDGIAKAHPAKAVQRAYRGSVLVAAKYGRSLSFGEKADTFMSLDEFADDIQWLRVITQFFQHADDLPHHFYMHLIHGAEILGYKHPDGRFRARWIDFYERCVKDFHLTRETEIEMDARLSDWERKHWTPSLSENGPKSSDDPGASSTKSVSTTESSSAGGGNPS